MLQDIAIVTGGQVVSDELGMSLKDVQLEWLESKTVKVQKENTIILTEQETRRQSTTGLSPLESRLKKTTSEYDKEN